MSMSRDDHLYWCKSRAVDYLDRGEIREGILSFLSDMQKHEETKSHGALMFLLGMSNNTRAEVKKFILDFN